MIYFITAGVTALLVICFLRILGLMREFEEQEKKVQYWFDQSQRFQKLYEELYNKAMDDLFTKDEEIIQLKDKLENDDLLS